MKVGEAIPAKEENIIVLRVKVSTKCRKLSNEAAANLLKDILPTFFVDWIEIFDVAPVEDWQEDRERSSQR